MKTKLLVLMLLAAAIACAATNVAILGSPNTAAWNDDVKAKLQATGLLGTIDVFNVTTTVPSLATLRTYDALLVYTDSHMTAAARATLGDTLADYIDGGGKVVDMVFADTNTGSCCFITGRFSTGGYSLISTAPQGQSVELTLGSYDPSHPLMWNVTSFDGGTSSFYGTGKVVPDATIVAQYSNGAPLAVTGIRSGYSRVTLNFYPPSSTVRSDLWVASTNGGTLMANALLYVAGVTPSMDLLFYWFFAA